MAVTRVQVWRGGASSDATRSKVYKRYVLVMLTFAYALSMSDQGLTYLLLQPIKLSLHLSDSQLGFVTGIGFALFYATMGVPVARWADRGNRGTIAAIAIGLWGAAVMSCLFVTNFAQLVAARAAASLGAAACMPPTYSLLGDYFTLPAERTCAMTIYALGNTLAASLGAMLGGWLNDSYGWRSAFFVIGAPALLMTALVKLSIAEPRARAGHARHFAESPPSMMDVLKTLWRRRSTRHLIAAVMVLSIAGFGLATWFPTFLIRSHGMRTSGLGVWLGLLSGLGGAAGTLLGGFVAKRWFTDNERGQVRTVGLVVASVVPLCALFLLLPGKLPALIAFVPVLMALMFFFGPTFALMQRLVTDDMRATALAVVLLLFNLIGMGAGAQLVGTLSDVLAASLGLDSLRYAMLIVSVAAVWSAYHFWEIGRTVEEDLRAVARPRGAAS